MTLTVRKISIIVTCCVLGIANLYAQGINFEHGTFNEALAKAKAENKLLFMDCYTTWCGPCKMMAKDVFPLEDVGTYFNENFVSLKMDMEKGEGIELVKRFNITAYPTMLFIDAQGEVVHKVVAYQDGPGLMEQGDIALNPEKQMNNLEQRYANGERDINFMMQFIKALGVENNRKRVKEVGTPFISSMQPDQYATEEGYTIIAYTGLTYKSDPFYYVLNNKDKFLGIESMPKEYYTYIIENAINDYINEIASTGTLEELKEAVEASKKDHISKENQALYENTWICSYYLTHKMYEKWWEQQLAYASKLMESDKKRGTYSIIQAAYELGQRAHFADADKALLLKAAQKIEEIKAADPENISSYYCLANVYKRIGDKAKALDNINAYIEKTKQNGGEVDRRVTKLKAEIESM